MAEEKLTTALDKLEATPRSSSDDVLPEKLDDFDVLNEDISAEKPVDDPKPVSIARLFQFATKRDIALNLAGTVFSCAAGAVTPVMIIVLSSMLSVVLEYETQKAEDADAANRYLDSR
ncbi:hypothetical protein GGF43_001518, partial [Coemansia sp. RSA 2618]